MCAQKCFLERVELRNAQPYLLALIILNKRPDLFHLHL